MPGSIVHLAIAENVYRAICNINNSEEYYNKFIIDNLLMQSESEQLEFKAHLDENAIAKNVTAMLNGRGGTILIGVNEEKSIVGVSPDIDTKKLLCSLMNKIRPSAPIDVQPVQYDAKRVILISVWEGAQKPYLYDGAIYQKIGAEGSIATPESVSKMLADRKESDYNWERMSVLSAEIEDLDMAEVRKTMDVIDLKVAGCKMKKNS